MRQPRLFNYFRIYNSDVRVFKAVKLVNKLPQSPFSTEDKELDVEITVFKDSNFVSTFLHVFRLEFRLFKLVFNSDISASVLVRSASSSESRFDKSFVMVVPNELICFVKVVNCSAEIVLAEAAYPICTEDRLYKMMAISRGKIFLLISDHPFLQSIVFRFL